MTAEVITKRGKYLRDPSGVFHYRFEGAGTVYEAISDALSETNAPEPAWFWFGGTFAPIRPGDLPDTLFRRYYCWTSAYQENPKQLLELLEEYATEAEK